MATVTKIQDFSEQEARGVHNFGSHTFKLIFSNSAPVATNTVKSDITEISAGNGYTAGGPTVSISLSEVSGTTTISGAAVTLTAAGGSIGPFRYYALYNDTAASKNLVQFWDHGSAVTLADGDSFQVKFNNADPGTILTQG